MTQTDNDRQQCWERVLKSNKLFRISHLFAPDEFSGALLALHALFASIEQISSEVSEELVARTKLEWWRFELSQGNIERSRHPVVRHLGETGAAATLPAMALQSLLDSTERRLDANPPSNMNEFNQLCRVIYQPRMHLECTLCGLDSSFVANHNAIALEGGLLQLLRESFVQAKHGFWWIPLNTLARFGVTRQDLRDNSDAHPARTVFGNILDDSREAPTPETRGPRIRTAAPPGLLHLQLTALLQNRQLQHLQSRQPSRFGAELNRWHISDLIAAWKMARQSNRTGVPN